MLRSICAIRQNAPDKQLVTISTQYVCLKTYPQDIFHDLNWTNKKLTVERLCWNYQNLPNVSFQKVLVFSSTHSNAFQQIFLVLYQIKSMIRSR